MKVELARVTLETPGVENARGRWAARQRLLVRLSDERGFQGLGEASPLPNYSPDLIDDVGRALRSLSREALAAALDADSVWAALDAVRELAPLDLPSARMALESAALDFWGNRSGCPAPPLLGAAAAARRPLARLLGSAAAPELLLTAKAALAVGFRSLKIKLGVPHQLESEVSALEKLASELPADVTLRLDANGALEGEQIQRFWPRLSRLPIEFFEEPTAVPRELPKSLPLALDESLQGASVTDALKLLERRGARAAVLKPTALGGLSHCWKLAEQALASGIDVVISHCFEGPVALRAASALALALPSGLAHGLAPHAGLGTWRDADASTAPGELRVWESPGLGRDLAELFS